MYSPAVFRLDDRDALLKQAAADPFATLITSGAGGLAVSHLPLLVDPGRGVLRGHLARANGQLAHLAAGAEALAIFHGPHGYVSPSWYRSAPPAVPTWNYVVVHARGRARTIDEPALAILLDELIAAFDTTGFRFDPPADYRQRMLGAIAGFEIAIDSLEGKFKLSQNRPPEDRESVADRLSRGDEASRALAALMRAQP